MSESPRIQPTVFIVDDDQQMRDTLVAKLEALDYRVRAFSGAKSFRHFYRPEMPGCLLLDLCLPRQSALDLYQQLVSENIWLPVIFFTRRADLDLSSPMKRERSISFENSVGPNALVEQLNSAIADDCEWRRLNTRLANLTSRIARITSRERETLALIRSGETNKAIAAKLRITERAVEMRRSSIMRKLQVRSVAELIDLIATHCVLEQLLPLYRLRIL